MGILIPATTLLHDEEEQDAGLRALDFPASLDGRVLVDRDTARRIAAQTGTWERLFTDPVTGTVVAVDSRRQTARQKAWLQARDGWCRAPGCAAPARRADVDHTVAWAEGGATALGNLGHLCRRDHGLKHDSRWAVRQLEHGVFEWASAIGQVLRTDPEPIGPVFTDPPRPGRSGRDRPPPLTPAEQRRRRTEIAAQMRADAERWNDPATRPEPPPQETTGVWAPLDDPTAAPYGPLPF